MEPLRLSLETPESRVQMLGGFGQAAVKVAGKAFLSEARNRIAKAHPDLNKIHVRRLALTLVSGLT